MIRKRLALLILSAGLGFLGGCSGSFSLGRLNGGLFHHGPDCAPPCPPPISGYCPTTECSAPLDCCPVCPPGPGPILAPPGGVLPPVNTPPLTPPPSQPNGQPRLIPTPAQPTPYSP